MSDVIKNIFCRGDSTPGAEHRLPGHAHLRRGQVHRGGQDPHGGATHHRRHPTLPLLIPSNMV